MSLTDIDKNSEDRGSPTPNHSDTVSQDSVKAHGTNSVNYFTDATSTPTGGSNSGTPGGGATIAAGFKKLVLTVPITVVNNGSTFTTATIAHGLTYTPMIEAALENANAAIAGGAAAGSSIPLPTFVHADIGTVTSGVVTFASYLYAFANATNVYVNMLNATGSPVSITVTCYLYQRVSR